MPAVARPSGRASQKQQKQKENQKSLKRKRDQEDLQKLQNAVDEFVGCILFNISILAVKKL